MSSEAEIRNRVAQACRVLGRLDITPSTVGHVSARDPETGRIYVRARGPSETGVRFTCAEDVIEVDLDGRRIGAADDGRTAPLEVHIHTGLYRSRSDVFSVAHVHPAAAVLLTITHRELKPIFGAYNLPATLIALNGICRFERSILIQTPELGAELASAMGDADVCTMHGHGITTAANSVEEAALLAINLNDLAGMTYQAEVLGGAAPISDEDQEVFRGFDMTSGYHRPEPGRAPGRLASLWSYYRRCEDGEEAKR